MSSSSAIASACSNEYNARPFGMRVGLRPSFWAVQFTVYGLEEVAKPIACPKIMGRFDMSFFIAIA
ncbi:MAG: hypothetical protein ACLP2Q_22605 [Steroidobacteraceae bacterium]